MNHFRMSNVPLAFLLVLIFGLGCDKSSKPPEPLAADQMPATFEKAFAKAPPDAKELSAVIAASMQAKDYPKAFQALQALTSQPGLNNEQTSVLGRGLFTLNTLLQESQSQGYQKAAETLKSYRGSK